jgi:hypothetical protein
MGHDITLHLESRPTTAKASVVEMLRTFEGVVSIKGVESCKALMSLRSLHTDTCLSYDSLGDVQLGLQCVHLTLDVEDARVGLVELAQLSKQSPVIDLPGHFHNLVEGRGIPLYILEEPGREWLGGLVQRVSARGVEIKDENRVAQASHGSQGTGDGCVEEFDVACLALLSIGHDDVEIGEAAVIHLIPLRALVLFLLGLLGAELGELAAKLSHLRHGVIMLVSVAEGGVAESNGDGAEGGWVKGVQGVEYVKGALGG